MEIMLHGNLFYCRFLGLSATDPVPDHSTIFRFRSFVQSMNLYRACFERTRWYLNFCVWVPREVLRKLLPEAHHQLCFTHFRRNLRNELSKELYQKVKEKMEKVKVAEDPEEGKALIEEVAELVEKEKPKMAKQIREKAGNYTSFLHYPREIRKHIYTTNPVEGLNRGLEVMRLELGGYFPSRQCLEANLFVQAVNLVDRWQRRPLPAVKAARAELKRLLILRYEMEEV